MLNEKKFRAIYDDYLASGLTIRDFCANTQLNETKFLSQFKSQNQRTIINACILIYYNKLLKINASLVSCQL
jgi:hypothetical protein